MGVLALAHSKNADGKRQELQEHLLNVAKQAAKYARSFKVPELAYYAGLLHDVGKFNPAFQQYLADAELHPSLRRRGPDHKGAGAIWATSMKLDLLAFLIAGHHGGLPSKAELKIWLREWAANSQTSEAIETAKCVLPELRAVPSNFNTICIDTKHEIELLIRMLFSALVDADFLDTEHHFRANQIVDRGVSPCIAALLRQFEKNQQQFLEQPDTPVNAIRHEVYQHCVKAAQLEPGFFRLTVPTGGGKTRSSLAFALHHARKYGLQRIIYAIPYMSITEQTADVFRKIFSDKHTVLEHHSGTATLEDPDTPIPEQVWNRLASENWDASLIVTTTIQLFESLMACTPSACRKLHNTAQSIIILDEAQMLPTHLLTPILDVLHQLVTHYGVTVVLCTATQPALDQRSGFPGLEGIREIVSDPTRLFTALKHVRYQLPHPGERLTWQQVGDKVREVTQALVIVNTRADALKLLDVLADPSAFHLSTWMCGAHRRAVLKEIRRRLQAGEVCHLISTQVIEAGVDVDFPIVLRAIGPLDRIVQAAGRGNREGLLPFGLVIVFDPSEGSIPPGPYRTGTDLTRTSLQDTDVDLDNPSVHQDYFEQYYRYVDLDEPHIQHLRESFNYPEVARNFRMITDSTTPVVVRYSDAEHSISIADLLDTLRSKQQPTGENLRSLQPYIVNLRPNELNYARKHNLVKEVVSGLWEWSGNYDPVRGLILDGKHDLDNLGW